jgi:hypothetical protein
MAILLSNNASAAIASSLTASSTSIILAAGQGGEFPSPGPSDYFYATLVDSSNNIEIVKCTARSADTLTVVRGQDGTSARSFAVGSLLELRIVAATFTDLQNEIVPDPLVPAGTKMLFVQTSAPTGWTKVTTYDDAALRIVAGTASNGGSVNFSTAFSTSGVTGATAISVSQMPSHNHVWADPLNSTRALYDPGGPGFLTNTEGGGAVTTSSVGGNGSHTHSLGNFAVKYVDTIIASKDA